MDIRPEMKDGAPTGRLIDRHTNRVQVIDSSGNLTALPRGVKVKAGWRLATEDDISYALRTEAERAAKEKAEEEARVAAARAAQDAADATPSGGPFDPNA